MIQSPDEELIYHLCTSSLYTPLNDAHVPITTCISDDAQFTQLTEPSTIVLEAQTSALAQRAVELLIPVNAKAVSLHKNTLSFHVRVKLPFDQALYHSATLYQPLVIDSSVDIQMATLYQPLVRFLIG